MKQLIEFVQTQLVRLQILKNTDNAADFRIAMRVLLSRHEPKALNYNEERRLIACLQVIINILNGRAVLKVDGFFGPNTEYWLEFTLDLLSNKAHDLFRDNEDESCFPETINPNGFPKADAESMSNYFGDPGDTNCHVMIELPYAMRIAWNPKQRTRRMTLNKKLEEPVQRVLHKVLEDYGADQITALGLDLFGGCFNFRNKRGGSTLSTHAWAAAFDFDPERNKLRYTAKQAQFAKPVYNKWWKAWEKEGFVSLGRQKNYDFMHIQATA